MFSRHPIAIDSDLATTTVAPGHLPQPSLLMDPSLPDNQVTAAMYLLADMDARPR